MSRFSFGRAMAVGLTMVATIGAAALATPGTAQALQQSAIADDAVGPMLFYRNFDGFNFTAEVAPDGGFIPRTSNNLGRGWTHVVAAGGGHVLLYRASDGLAAVGSVQPATGVFSSVSTLNLFPGWSHITHTGGGRLLFYRASDGLAITRKMDPNGTFRLLELLNFDRNWSQITHAGDGRLLFYRSSPGALAAGVMRTSDDLFANLWSKPVFTANLTQIAYAGGGRVVMYHRTNGFLMTFKVTDNNLEGQRTFFGFDRDWATVTYAGGGRVLFYRVSTGVAAIIQVDGSGGYLDLLSTGLNENLSQITTPLI